MKSQAAEQKKISIHMYNKETIQKMHREPYMSKGKRKLWKKVRKGYKQTIQIKQYSNEKQSML